MPQNEYSSLEHYLIFERQWLLWISVLFHRLLFKLVVPKNQWNISCVQQEKLWNCYKIFNVIDLHLDPVKDKINRIKEFYKLQSCFLC